MFDSFSSQIMAIINEVWTQILRSFNAFYGMSEVCDHENFWQCSRLETSLTTFIGQPSLHKKWSFPLGISSINVTKSTGNFGFGHIYCRNPSWKTSFFVQCFLRKFSAFCRSTIHCQSKLIIIIIIIIIIISEVGIKKKTEMDAS